MTAYTHWDLVLGFVARVYMSEVYFLAPDGTDNVTVGGTASTKMGVSYNGAAQNVFDRNTGSYSDPGENGLVFGANFQFVHNVPVEVSQVNVRWHYWPVWEGARTCMQLRASNDGVNYDQFNLVNFEGFAPVEPPDNTLRFYVAPFAPVGVPQVLARAQSDVRFAGDGVIAGHVKVEGAIDSPLYARVTLLSAKDRSPAAEVWSDPITGAYAFSGLDRRAQFLLAVFEPSGAYVPGLSKVVTPT